MAALSLVSWSTDIAVDFSHDVLAPDPLSINGRLLREKVLQRQAEQRVVVTMSTNPVRLLKIAPVLNAICFEQTRPPDRLILSLPFAHERVDKDFVVPRWLI
eukprot:373522-Prymnesium_polylepis.1